MKTLFELVISQTQIWRKSLLFWKKPKRKKDILEVSSNFESSLQIRVTLAFIKNQLNCSVVLILFYLNRSLLPIYVSMARKSRKIRIQMV